MQFRHQESYRILSDGRILQDPMGSGVWYVDLGRKNLDYDHSIPFDLRDRMLALEEISA